MGSSATVLCIAHRLETVVFYDRILVLDQGQLAEYGSPRRLLSWAARGDNGGAGSGSVDESYSIGDGETPVVGLFESLCAARGEKTFADLIEAATTATVQQENQDLSGLLEFERQSGGQLEDLEEQGGPVPPPPSPSHPPSGTMRNGQWAESPGRYSV